MPVTVNGLGLDNKLGGKRYISKFSQFTVGKALTHPTPIIVKLNKALKPQLLKWFPTATNQHL